jgi:hypothetical protein
MASPEPIAAVVETAALDLFYRYPRLVYSAEETEKLTPVVKKLAGPLRVERAFAGLCWPDAHRLVGAMVSAVCDGEPADTLNGLAKRAREGLEDVRDWVDENAVARSLDIIADLLRALRK